MKKYGILILIGIIVGLITTSSIFRSQCLKYKNLYNKERQNVEAYALQNSKLEQCNREFLYSLEDLKKSKDSLDVIIYQQVKQLKIKDNNIKYLQYHNSVASKTDTIILPGDTIFKETMTSIDTTVYDNWYKLNLKLSYPSTIVVSPQFKSEKFVTIYNKKEYNKTPSKWFFIRWFQKKHLVTEVNVEEKSPYIINGKQKFIKVE